VASQLVWKVFSGRELVASTMYAEDAALVVANTAQGIVKVDGRIVWREGRESIAASESYDQAAGLMIDRRRQHHAERYARTARFVPRQVAYGPLHPGLVCTTCGADGVCCRHCYHNRVGGQAVVS
jgi:hypothetical protein